MSIENDRKQIPSPISILVRSVVGWTAALLSGVIGLFIAKTSALPDMFSAQMTIGLVGFVGGWSHSVLISVSSQFIFPIQS